MKGSLLSAQVVEPYAEALITLAQPRDLLEPFGSDLRSLLTLLKEAPELSSVFASPLIKSEDKKAVIRRLMGDQSNPYLVNFLLLLVDRRRIMFLEAIARKYLERLRQLNNQVLAVVTAASELNEEQCQAVSEKVKQLTGAAGVELETSIAPDLIGGVVIRVGSQVYDASLRGQLRRIGLALSSTA